MNSKKIIISVLFFGTLFSFSQSVTGVYKINDLMNRLKNKDTSYIVNFWATWCKPCVEELSGYDTLNSKNKNKRIKVDLFKKFVLN